MSPSGQRVRSSRWSHDHPGQLGKPITGRRASGTIRLMNMKGMRMQTADQILQAIRKLGEQRQPLTRIYRCLYNPHLYLAAYNKIYRNQGALTPGTANETVDGSSSPRTLGLLSAGLTHSLRHNSPSMRRSLVPSPASRKTACTCCASSAIIAVRPMARQSAMNR